MHEDAAAQLHTQRETNYSEKYYNVSEIVLNALFHGDSGDGAVCETLQRISSAIVQHFTIKLKEALRLKLA